MPPRRFQESISRMVAFFEEQTTKYTSSFELEISVNQEGTGFMISPSFAEVKISVINLLLLMISHMVLGAPCGRELRHGSRQR